MESEIAFSERDGYLEVKIQGNWQLEHILGHITQIGEEAIERGHDHVLLDVRGLSAPERDVDRFLTGQHIAEVWGYGLRVAVIWRADAINQLAVNTAVNRGADITAFVDRPSALRWLMESPSP